jgi:hypothetical protein
VPVADGGGECGLDNYRLLCRPCHVRVTLAWRAQRQAAVSDARRIRSSQAPDTAKITVQNTPCETSP